ncbi:hypothetical protein PAMA_018723 [Pampus argenteus]
MTNPSVESESAVSELLEDSGNRRQSISLHLLSGSLFSEQQKLRHVLDWARSFLSSGSEVHHEFCRADNLILANEIQRETRRGSAMCPGLQHLNIGQVPKVNSHSFTVMASQLKCLISLNLTGLQAVTDVTVETLLQSCTNLQSLTLSSCPGVTDQTLHNISKYTPGIRSLDVSGCKAVTDAGIRSLAVGCRRLHKLDVSSTDTGNRGVTLLASYCGVDLHTVKLSFCHISSESILKLCRRCKRLKVLHLYGCAQLPTEQEIREVNTTVKVCPLP